MNHDSDEWIQRSYRRIVTTRATATDGMTILKGKTATSKPCDGQCVKIGELYHMPIGTALADPGGLPKKCIAVACARLGDLRKEGQVPCDNAAVKGPLGWRGRR